METKRLSGWLISIGNAFGASGFQQLISRFVKSVESTPQVESGVGQLRASCGIAM